MAKLDRLTCEEAFRRFNDYLDNELDPHDTQRMREHLELCAVCAREFDFEASVLNEIRAKINRVEAPPDLLARLRETLQEESRGSDAS